MADDAGAAAWAYHEHTKHSPESVRSNRHVLDWPNQPIPYKLYEELPPIPLPRDWPAAAMPAIDAVASPAQAPDRVARLDLATLARLLHCAGGIVRKMVYANGRESYFRAAACTGALYHVDLYVVCGTLADLDAGVYHFGPHDFSLRRLRGGDHRATVIAATAREPAVATAPVVLVSVSTYWRNAWKYQARAYRHCFWDDGTILANLLAAAVGAALPARVILGFVDATIAHVIGTDPEREAVLSLVALGHDPDARQQPEPDAPPLALTTTPLSTHEIDYADIRAIHAASMLSTPVEVEAWRHGARALAASATVASPAARADAASPTTAGRMFPLESLAPVPGESVDAVIGSRGSTRQFAYRALSAAQLATILSASAGDIAADFLEPGAPLSTPYLIVNAVDGVPSGAYVYRRAHRALELVRAGDFRQTAGFLDLGQELAADASVNVYLLADLRRVLPRLGNRGYRAAQLEAAIAGGKLYLAAYALGLGATGLTFFDDPVIEFFSPHAAGMSVMFLVAIGVPRKRKAHGSP